MDKDTYVITKELVREKLFKRNYFQKGMDVFNPKKLGKDTIKAGLFGALYHVGTFTIMDPFTALSAGISTSMGSKMGNSSHVLMKAYNLTQDKKVINSEEQSKVLSDLEKMKKTVYNVQDNMHRSLFGLMGIIGYDISQAETINEALSNGLVDTGVAFGTGLVALLISININKNL